MSALDAPADTRIMGIIHTALQRDLVRVRDLLAAAPPPEGRQRRALGEHVTWLMDFLHGHHSSEDAGLWPLVRQRNPRAADLMDSLEADHARISPAAARVEEVAVRYRTTTTDAPRTELVQALDGLLEVLVPHLDREVDEAMPVVAASITAQEWNAVEQAYNIEPKSMWELAMEGHWLIDGIDAEGYDVVVGTVPPVQRFVLIHGFGWAYRRRARARWTADGASRRTAAR